MDKTLFYTSLFMPTFEIMFYLSRVIAELKKGVAVISSFAQYEAIVGFFTSPMLITRAVNCQYSHSSKLLQFLKLVGRAALTSFAYRSLSWARTSIISVVTNFLNTSNGVALDEIWNVGFSLVGGF